MTDTPSVRTLATRVVRTLVDAGFATFYVGGSVRDSLLGRPEKDIDIATAATPAEVLDFFPDAERVGAHFGVVLVKDGSVSVEVATFRLDGVYENGRHPTSVQFTTDIREDVNRRDFTVNALVRDQDGTLHDFVDGRRDLELGVIRTVGHPHFRFKEDALRMLRAVRFAAQLNFRLADETFIGIRDKAASIVKISAERTRDELSCILTSGRASYGIDLLRQTDLLRYILPEVEALVGVQQNALYHPEGDVYTHTHGLLQKLEPGCSLTLALAALLHDIGKPATLGSKLGEPTFHGHEEVGAEIAAKILARLKYPIDVIETVRNHVADHMRFRVAREMRRSKLYRFLRQPNFQELLALHRLDALSGSGNLSSAEFVENVLAEVPPEKISPARLLTGRDLIDLGLTPGPQFGDILESLETEQLEGRITDREQALEYVQSRLSAGVWA